VRCPRRLERLSVILDTLHGVGQAGVHVEGLFDIVERGIQFGMLVRTQRVALASIVQRVQHQQSPIGHVSMELLAQSAPNLPPLRKRARQFMIRADGVSHGVAALR
jgi:hypothetical protein